jgi:hypothetical protein
MWKTHRYQPIREASGNDVSSENAEKLPVMRMSTISWSSLVVLGVLLVATNGTWYWHYVHGQTHCSQKGPLSYLGEAPSRTSLRPHHWNTDFSTDDKTVSNPLWASLFPTGAGLVTVPKSWAAEHSLPVSKENPSNSSNAVYFTAVYHQLHCLTVVRAALYHFRENVQQTVPWKHVSHCLDSLRQVVMCNRDDALLYTEDGNVFGDGQVHQCRDWDSLQQWVAQHAYLEQ